MYSASEDGNAILSLPSVDTSFTSEPLKAKMSNHFVERLVPDTVALFEAVSCRGGFSTRGHMVSYSSNLLIPIDLPESLLWPPCAGSPHMT